MFGHAYNEYGYDDLGRLTDAEYHDSDSEAFVMDALGNRTGNQTLREDGSVNFTVDSSTNRYTTIGGNSIAHDEAGNLTVDKDGYKYSYDYENRVVKIQKPDGSGGWDDVAEMAYDALGRRIRVIDSIAATTTLYYYNPEWQCLAEYTGAGALQRYFVYGNYIDEPLVMHRQSDGEDYYYGQDYLYSTVVLIDDGGSVTERYEYDAYGTVLVYTDDGNDDTWFTGDDTTASASAKGNPYTFTGRRLDVLDGGDLLRMHYRHRDYDAYAGRFFQHDPFQYSDGLNLYEYVGLNPIQSNDPHGTLTNVVTEEPGPIKKVEAPPLEERIEDGYITMGHWGSNWFFLALPTVSVEGGCSLLQMEGRLTERWYWAVDSAAEAEELWELGVEEKYWREFTDAPKGWYWATKPHPVSGKGYNFDFIVLVVDLLQAESTSYRTGSKIEIFTHDVAVHPNVPSYARALNTAKEMHQKAEEKRDNAYRALKKIVDKKEWSKVLCCE